MCAIYHCRMENCENERKKTDCVQNCHVPSSVFNRDPMRLFLSEAPCSWSHAINCGQAASACNNVFRKQVRPKLWRPAIWPRRCLSRELPAKNVHIELIDRAEWHQIYEIVPDGPQKTNAPTTTAAVTPAAINIFSPSILFFFLIIFHLLSMRLFFWFFSYNSHQLIIFIATSKCK